MRSISRRIERDLSRRGFIAGVGASLTALGFTARTPAHAAERHPPLVLANAMLFDGISPALRGGLRVLVADGRIKSLATGDTPPPEGARTIDCGGRTLMPGLIDAHWHSTFAAVSAAALLSGDVGYILLAAAAEAERTLMRGFTTVRDLGGPAFALKQAIDEGLVPGPRIFPCGAMIAPSGGHGDLRPLTDLPRSSGDPSSLIERSGGAGIADGADEVRLRVREQILRGASQIKLTGSGGVSSPRTTVDMVTFTEVELRAAVETASDRQTYVTVHAYPSAAVQRAVNAGVQCIEHAHLIDDATARLMAEKDVWLSTQPFVSEADTGPLTGQSQASALRVIAGSERIYNLAKEHRLKTAFGSDLLFSPEQAARQGIMLTHLKRWYDAATILRMATATNADLLSLSGPRNPYPGPLGVIAEGAYADLLVVEGDPLQNIDILADASQNLRVIVKDGRIHKNTL